MSSIGSIISGSVSSVTGITSARSNSGPSSTRAAPGARSDSTSVSGPAAMLNKLKSLQQTDPAKFKEVMSDISTKLKDAAASSSDEKDKAAMTDLAQKFATAGQTGDLQALAPPHGKGGGGRGHSRPPPGPPPAVGAGKAGSAAASASKTTEAADANGDGKVSEAEREAYAAKESAATSAPSSAEAAAAYRKVAEDPAPKGNDLFSRISSIVDSALAA